MEIGAVVGEYAPDFTLLDLQGKAHTLSGQRGRLVILNIWSAECSWGERVDRELRPLLDRWGEAVTFWCLAPNSNEPPELLARVAAERGFPLVLLDPGARVAGRYGAQITPHFFVVDPAGVLVYQGSFDDLTFRKRTSSRRYLEEAVDAVLAGHQPNPAQTPPYGCAIVQL